MTDAPTATNVISVAFSQLQLLEWRAQTTCPHGTTRNSTYLIAAGVPPLNHSGMVQSAWDQHAALVGCLICSRAVPPLNASVTFQPANAVQPGAQRYISQSAATIAPPAKNFLFGPRLTCAKLGAYQLVGKVQLSRGLAQGARGAGVVVISGVPVLSVPMVDEGARATATANINVMLNLAPNQSVELGYENTSSQVQDVQLTTLTVSEVWVP